LSSINPNREVTTFDFGTVVRMFPFTMAPSYAKAYLLSLLVFANIAFAFSPPQFAPVKVDSPYGESIVHSILEDRDGFIWLGTVDGLCFYDGYDFKFYQEEDGLSSNVIRNLTQDIDGYIWVATQDAGLNRFDKEAEEFVVFNGDEATEKYFKSDDAWKLTIDNSGKLWIGTWSAGLFRFDGLNDANEFLFTQFEHDPEDGTSLSHNIVREIYEDSEGALWIGTQGGGLTRFDRKRGVFNSYRHDPTNPRSVANDGVYALIEDSSGVLWVGTNGGGLCAFDRINETFTRFPDVDSRYITSLLELEPGYLLVGTESGLRLFEVETGEFSPIDDLDANPKNSLKLKLIRSLYRDRQGIVWAGTESGVYKQVISKRFEHYKNDPRDPNSLNYNTTRSMIKRPDGVLWVGTLGNGVNRFDTRTGLWKHYTQANSGLEDNVIVSLGVDKQGTLWAGTMNGFLAKLDETTGRFTSYELDAEPVNTPNMIQSIVEDDTGVLWIGTENGISRFNPLTETWDHVRHDPNDPQSLSGNNIQSKAVYFDRKGDLWVGTFGWGLNRIPKDQLHQPNPRVDRWIEGVKGREALSSDNVISIHEDEEGFLWLGTYGGGICKVDPETGSVSVVDTKNGLSNDVIYAIQEDHDGNLWCSTQNGLNRIDKSTGKIRIYTDRDGLQANAFFWGSATQGPEGWIYFGGHNGFNRFKPEDIQENLKIPPVYITDFTISANQEVQFEKAIHVTDSIVLEPHQNFFSIQYAALDFSDPQRNRYRYRLEGIDRDWVEAGNRQVANYTNIPPGAYLFTVQGSNNDGIWNEIGASVTVKVLPTFIQTNVFKILVALMVLALVFSMYRIRMHSIRKQQVLLQKRVEERTSELNEANQQLELHRNNLEKLVAERTEELEQAKDKAEESDKLKSSFLANMSHEIRTPLNAIVGFSSLLTDSSLSSEEQEDYIEMIADNSNLLVLLVDDILDLSKIEAGQLSVSHQVFSLGEMIREIIQHWKIQKSNPNVSIRSRNNLRRGLVLTTDPYRLKQILNNLMSNAVKFTENGEIELAVNQSSHHIEISVSDTGIGIPKESLALVFDRFTKIEASNTVLYRGSGLGLAISKRLAHLLGGDLTVNSQSGVGSVFTLKLPKAILEGEEGLETESKHTKSESVFDANEFDWRDKTLLVVEDEVDNFKLLKELLESYHAKADHAKDGYDAVELFTNHGSYDLVLMDIKMPRMDGYAAMKEIRKINPDQIVVAQTAYARPEDKKKLFESGFDAVISKPIKLSEFGKTLSELMLKSTT
jgi:signal transduction histidine kinase/ligand-binding sensor domain-containing protein